MFSDTQKATATTFVRMARSRPLTPDQPQHFAAARTQSALKLSHADAADLVASIVDDAPAVDETPAQAEVERKAAFALSLEQAKRTGGVVHASDDARVAALEAEVDALTVALVQANEENVALLKQIADAQPPKPRRTKAK